MRLVWLHFEHRIIKSVSIKLNLKTLWLRQFQNVSKLSLYCRMILDYKYTYLK